MNTLFKITFSTIIVLCTNAFSQNISYKSLVGEILSTYKDCESKIDSAHLSGLSLEVSQELKRLGGIRTPSRTIELNKLEDDFKKSIDLIIECADELRTKSDYGFKNSLEKQPANKEALTRLKISVERLISIFASPPTSNKSAAWDLYYEEVRRQGAPFKRAAIPLANETDLIFLNIYFK